MKKVLFSTGNKDKMGTARFVCDQYGIELVPAPLEIIEIQSEHGEDVASHKVSAAYKMLQQPVVVTDDSWLILGLNGFPGPYMKSMNHWFGPSDWENITSHLNDRRILLRQILAYQDGEQQKIFKVDIEGVLLKSVQGKSPHANHTLVSFDGQNSVAKVLETQPTAIADRRTAWHDFAEWLTKS